MGGALGGAWGDYLSRGLLPCSYALHHWAARWCLWGPLHGRGCPRATPISPDCGWGRPIWMLIVPCVPFAPTPTTANPPGPGELQWPQHRHGAVRLGPEAGGDRRDRRCGCQRHQDPDLGGRARGLRHHHLLPVDGACFVVLLDVCPWLLVCACAYMRGGGSKGVGWAGDPRCVLLRQPSTITQSCKSFYTASIGSGRA